MGRTSWTSPAGSALQLCCWSLCLSNHSQAALWPQFRQCLHLHVWPCLQDLQCHLANFPSKEYHSNMHVVLHRDWCFCFIGVTHLFFLYFCSSPNSNRAKTPSGKQLFSKHHNILIFLLSLFFFFYVGSEVAYGSFIFTYSKDYVGMNPVQAVGLNSLFWGTFAAGRGLAIFFAPRHPDPTESSGHQFPRSCFVFLAEIPLCSGRALLYMASLCLPLFLVEFHGLSSTRLWQGGQLRFLWWVQLLEKWFCQLSWASYWGRCRISRCWCTWHLAHPLLLLSCSLSCTK